MEDGDICNTRLGLGIGLGDFGMKKDRQENKKKRVIFLDLSISPTNYSNDVDVMTEGSSSKGHGEEDGKHGGKNRVFVCSKGDGENGYDSNCGRKKLRLTKEQTTLLEDNFKQHTTLNTVHKRTLAQKLNLKPRQVEVWFQNRRARTKLKQTETEYELLKKTCQNISEENRRLKKELQELRQVKTECQTPPPFFIQLPKAAAPATAATLTVCKSCQKTAKTATKWDCYNNIGKHQKKHDQTAATAAVSEVVQNPSKGMGN